MKKLLLLALTAVSLLAWDCTLEKPSTGGKSREMYCRNLSVLNTANYSDRARIQLGYGYSQAEDKTQTEMAKILMEQSGQCYSTCRASFKKAI